MAFDINSDEIAQLMAALSSNQNQLVYPSLEQMPVGSSSPFGNEQQPQQAMPQPGMQDMSQMIPQQTSAQAPRSISQTYPDSFSGMGMGATAPKVNEGSVDWSQILAMLSQQDQGLGGF